MFPRTAHTCQIRQTDTRPFTDIHTKSWKPMYTDIKDTKTNTQSNNTKSEERVWPADLTFIIHSEVEIAHKYQGTMHLAIEMLQIIVIS